MLRCVRADLDNDDKLNPERFSLFLSFKWWIRGHQVIFVVQSKNLQEMERKYFRLPEGIRKKIHATSHDNKHKNSKTENLKLDVRDGVGIISSDLFKVWF